MGKIIKFENRRGYSLSETFQCGQAFRFKPLSSGKFRGVFRGAVVEFQEKGDELWAEQKGRAVEPEELRRFLDFDRNYQTIQADLVKAEPHLKLAIDLATGLRLLQQDPFEATLSFILSSNSNMKKIELSIERLCSAYGEKIACIDGLDYHSFPDLETLKSVPEQAFKELGFGYRAGYVWAFVQNLPCEENLKAFEGENLVKLHTYLMDFKGIGDKVARCAELFGFGRLEAFPIDVWIKRYFYWELEKPNWSDEQMRCHARETYGAYAGIAQQYMFKWMITKYK